MAGKLENPSCFLYGPGVAKFEESPYPKIEDQRDVIIRIKFVGVCGSDVHFWNHGGIRDMVSECHPLIMGHEASGTVHEIGHAVTSLKVGDRVAIEPGYPCRYCKTCKNGQYNLCTKMKFAASPPDTNGTLTKFFRTPADFCYKLPDYMGLDEGALVEPLAVAVHAARLADIKLGQTVAVFGAGTIGLLCAAVSKALGAKKVISVDVNNWRLEFARKFAATGTFQPLRGLSAEESASKLIDLHGLDEGADVVLEATGVESCIDAGIRALRSGGKFVQVGLGMPIIQFPIVELSAKEVHMIGSFRYNSGDYDVAMHLLESKKVSVKELITGVEPFERATHAWERTKKGEGIKNLIQGPRD